METVAAAATSSSATTEVIRVRGLTFTYPKSSQPAVRGMDFSVGRGEIFGFLGPSGAGKSTTQKLLIGLLRGHGGEATVWGKDPLAWGPDYYQRIGVSFELPNHYQKLTGLENLRFFASLYDGETLDPMELLDAVGLADDANTRVGKYSKGMQMRLTFVRALINDPELLFLDEPTSGLDPVNARKVKNIVLDLKARGRTVFLTTHDMATADELCDRVAFVVDGQIVAMDTPTELKIARSERLVRVEYRGEGGRWRPPTFRWTAWPTTRRSIRCCAPTMSKPSTAGKRASTMSSSRPRDGSCHDPVGKRVAARADAAGPAEVPARGDLLGAHLAGGASAVVARPAAGRRALRPARRHLHHRVLLRRGHGVLREAGANAGCGHLAHRFGSGSTLAAKLTLLVLISLFVALVVPTIAHGFAYHLAPLVAGVVLGTLLMLLVGFASSLPFASISDWFLAATIPLAVLTVPPVLHYSGVWPNPMLYVVPTQGPMLLLGAAFDQVTLAPWQVVYAVVYPVALDSGTVLGGQGDVHPLRHRRVGRHVMAPFATLNAKALAAFGRNDLRGTYRDPLLVMIVVAPVIWTTGVAVLTPRFTDMLADRYQFDLVPYYPLILTAFLLLTSIIIVGGLAAFLVLDEIDAGTLTVLRVTPVPMSTLFGYRAATVMVVTTIYVIATMSFSGILEPGLVPALIPIGLLAGLSAVVSMLLILAMASNKIQGLAAVRALGMLIAGLPCLPWFIHSGWNLAFGVLPPYWAAKAFWVASDHGTWWPYLVGGVVYNLAVAWPLFRRFLAKHT